MRKHHTPIVKIAATFFAIPLIALETLLNAEHIAHGEGWLSSLVAAAAVSTIAAAAALPIAERAVNSGELGKARSLRLFFAIMLAFSLSTSIERIGSQADAKTGAALSHNESRDLLKTAYTDARDTQKAECASGRGPKCVEAEKATERALRAYTAAQAPKAVASGDTRIAAATGIDVAAVALYKPLLFPIGLQLGGFAFLAFGLAPRRRKAPTAPAAKAEAKPKRKPAARKAPAPVLGTTPLRRVA